MDAAVNDMILTVAMMAENARKNYADTEQLTQNEMGSCMTIRVPFALLNRIRNLAKEAGITIAPAA